MTARPTADEIVSSDPPVPDGQPPDPQRKLTPEAERALAEAADRRRLRQERERSESAAPKEVGGRQGPDPVRHGDWEKNGITSDF